MIDLRILIRGSNDTGSAVAHRLFSAGYAVAIHDISQPTTTRRKMAFSDAVFDGHAILDGVEARRIDELLLLHGILVEHEYIPVTVLKFPILSEALRPHVLVDARMRKHLQPEVQRGLAPLSIGLGPNFVAGETTDLAIETAWGETLGRVITQGLTNPLRGEPKELGGHARDRYVYAPCSGTFRTRFHPGDAVEQGQEIALIGLTTLQAPLDGLLRGIVRDGVPVITKTKVVEVDPRGTNAQISGIAERPARIAEGVLQAIQTWEQTHHAD